MSNASALAEQIFANADPLLAREYVQLLLTSEDPKTFREYFDLRTKMKQKEAAGSGSVLSVTFDFSGVGMTVETKPAEVIEADDLRPADATPQLPEPEPFTIDFDELLSFPEGSTEASQAR